jgi:hypothetical protein
VSHTPRDIEMIQFALMTGGLHYISRQLLDKKTFTERGADLTAQNTQLHLGSRPVAGPGTALVITYSWVAWFGLHG